MHADVLLLLLLLLLQQQQHSQSSTAGQWLGAGPFGDRWGRAKQGDSAPRGNARE